jgi:hypothetical protein
MAPMPMLWIPALVGTLEVRMLIPGNRKPNPIRV